MPRVVSGCDGARLGEPLGDVNTGIQEDVAPGIESAGPHDEFGFAAELGQNLLVRDSDKICAGKDLVDFAL